MRILRDEGPQSRATLSRRSKLSATTLTHLAAQMLADGVVCEQETPANGTIGRPGLTLALQPDSRHVAGVHIGAGLVQLVITNLVGQIKAEASFQFQLPGASPEAVITEIAAEIHRLMAVGNVQQLLGIGLAVPGPVDMEQRHILASINTGWRNLPLAAMLEQRTGVAVLLEHNVTAMAVAETRFGLGRDVAAVLYVYLRSGLGAGLVIDGTPFRPGGHGAVELGHIQISQNGPPCSCGNHGCLESYVNERVLLQQLGLSGNAPAYLLTRLEGTAVWQSILTHLTNSLAIAVNLLTPDLILFGGHLAEAPDSLFAHLQAQLPSRVMPHMRDLLRIERSSLGGNGGAIGGAATALDHFFYSGVQH